MSIVSIVLSIIHETTKTSPWICIILKGQKCSKKAQLRMVDSLTLSDDIVRTIDLLVPFIFLLISPGVLWGPEPELEERRAQPEPVLCPLGDASVDLRDGGYYESREELSLSLSLTTCIFSPKYNWISFYSLKALLIYNLADTFVKLRSIK